MKTKSGFFKVITQSQTYQNMLFLLLSFPLGIFYFVFLVTGLSLGIGLAITLIGIPILFGMLLLWRVFAGFERQLTKIMLSIDIAYVPIKQPKGIWKKVQAYLIIKFPLGIFSFVVLVTLLSVSLSLIAVPVLYYLTEIEILNGTFCIPGNICFVNSYFSAIIWGIIGILLLFVSLHALNGLARISGLLAKSMLEKKK